MVTKLLVFLALIATVVGYRCWDYDGPRHLMMEDATTCDNGDEPCWVISSKDYVRAECARLVSYCDDTSDKREKEEEFLDDSRKRGMELKIRRSECCRGHLCNGGKSLSSLLPLTLSLLSFIGYSMQ